MSPDSLAAFATELAAAMREKGIASLVLEPHGDKLRCYARDAAGNLTECRAPIAGAASVSMTVPAASEPAAQ